jgi:glycerophosphoryl diester phosphodiesterase
MRQLPHFSWRAAAISVIAVTTILSIYYGPAIVLGQPLHAPLIVIAHRGGAARQPENTLAAFRQAVADGVTWLEFDVQLTADGVPVVIHDTDVARTTNATGPVAALTLAEVRALDAGDGETIPTLDEVITYARRQGVVIVPEAKAPELYPGIETKIVDAVRRAGYTDRTVVQSFSTQALQTLHDLDPNLQLCALTGPGKLVSPDPLPGSAEYICPMAEMVLFNPYLIHQAHRRGIQTLVWFGLGEPRWLVHLILWLGVDGVMLDDPTALPEPL